MPRSTDRVSGCLSIGAAGVARFVADPAFAQTTAAATQQVDAADDKSGLQEIVVTSQRRNESLHPAYRTADDSHFGYLPGFPYGDDETVSKTRIGVLTGKAAVLGRSQAFVVCFVQNSTVRERNDSSAIPSPPTRSFR